jgi:hypothetical protein
VEESKLREKPVSFTENTMAAAACVGFDTEIEEEAEGSSVWTGRGVSIWGDEGNLL